MASPADDQAIVSSAEYGPNPIFGQAPANYDNDSSVDNNEAVDDYNPFDETTKNQQTDPQETANNDNNDNNNQYNENMNDNNTQPTNNYDSQPQPPPYTEDAAQPPTDYNPNVPPQPYTQTYDGQQQPPPNTQYEQDNKQPPPTSYNVDTTTTNNNDNTNNNENAADYYYDQDPQDVVAQMREDNPDLAVDDDDPDYGSATQPKTDADDDSKAGPIPQGLFGIFFIRTIYIAASLFLFSIMAMPLWFSDTKGTDFGAGFGLSGFGCVIMMLTSLAAIAMSVVVKLGIPIPFIHFMVLGVMVSYIVAGVFYILGGIAVAAVWNDFGNCDTCSAIAGLFFGEAVFIGGHCCVAGLDLWKQWLNNKKWRTIVYCSALALAALILFFSYAILNSETESEYAGLGLCAAGYFFVGIVIIVYVLFEMIPIIKETLVMSQNLVALIIAGLFVLFVLFVFFGYIAIAADDEIFGEDASSYFAGFGLVVLFTSIIIALDMKFGEFLPGGKEGLEEEENKGQPAINFDDDEDISPSPQETDNIMVVDRDQNDNMNNNGQNNDNMQYNT